MSQQLEQLLFPTQIVKGNFQEGQLYLTAFIGRGDYFNKKRIGISNESIPRLGHKWVNTPHVITSYKDHILYMKPKDMVFSSNRDLIDFLKLQTIPHKTGHYVDWFFTTDKRGIHNLYATSVQTDPLAIQAWKEGTFPKYTSSSLFALARAANGIITDWEPIDNTSVDEDPAYGIELAKISGDCFCEASNGNSCIVELRDKVQKAHSMAEIAQSGMDHADRCKREAFKSIKNYFKSDNVHYQFLVQSSLMSSTEGSTNAGQAASTESQSKGAPIPNQNGSEAQYTKTDVPSSAQDLSHSFDFLSQTLGTKPKVDAEDKNVSTDTSKPEQKKAEGETEEKKPEGENEGEKKPGDEKPVEAPAPTIESLQARINSLERENKKLQKDNDEKIMTLVKFQEKQEAKDRTELVSKLVKTLGKDKISEKHMEQLIEYYTSDKDLKKLSDKKLTELIKIQMEMGQAVITEKVKQSSMFPADLEMTAKFLAQDTQSGEKPKSTFIDVRKLGEYLS